MACGTAVVAFAAAVERLSAENSAFVITEQMSDRQIAEMNRIGSLVRALESICGPLAAAALIAVAAILALLALRWELRRAARMA
ncbi:hypothetical protein [Pseudolysinimonas sp.]|uniref:hypothetical protein n=1 Tax=Pseudolysinimonas sp. TaxID=2680009 RepID=UPI003F7D2EAC